MSNKNYNPGKIWPIIKITVGLIKENPALLDNPDYLKATLKSNIEELNHAETCGNCGASMLEYIFEFDCLDALLLLTMARRVRNALNEGVPFTEANKIRVQSLQSASYAMKSRTTQMSKLGLLAKYIGENGRHEPGMWVITRRGFDALKGRKVPKSVRVWRGKIEERHDEKTTLAEAFAYHRSKVEDIIKKKKQPKNDYRAEFADYDQREWYTVGPVHEGTLL